MSILPVTVLAGSPTGDEAWLLSQLREGTTDRRITSIVPKGRSRSRQPGLLPTTERLVRLGRQDQALARARHLGRLRVALPRDVLRP